MSALRVTIGRIVLNGFGGSVGSHDFGVLLQAELQAALRAAVSSRHLIDGTVGRTSSSTLTLTQPSDAKALAGTLAQQIAAVVASRTA